MKRPSRATAATTAAALRRQAIKVSHAPKSISAIMDHGFLDQQKRSKDDIAVVIRPVGCTRRVFLLKTFLTSDEIEGLAYRIRALTKNDSLNSVLIATDGTDVVANEALPSTLIDRYYPYSRIDLGLPPAPGCTYHVAGGYDPVALYKSGLHRNKDAVQGLLSNLTDLALAMRGNALKTKIPTISIPHGHVHDGGFALCCSSSYVLATRETRFSIRHPSMGLALDPVGLSYILPRLGQEFNQAAARFRGCGIILGLMGYEADAADMMETGLATHYIETPVALGLMEHTLSEIPPWNQQDLLQNPVRFHGDPEPIEDHNLMFRNVAVADAVNCFCSYRADGDNLWVTDDQDAPLQQDPSLLLEKIPWHETPMSDLVFHAAVFNEIFTEETTLVGILERFREVASRETSDPKEQARIDFAQDFCHDLERQSPLALSAIYSLLKEGSKGTETLQKCMARERNVQSKLLSMTDFERWANWASQSKNKSASFSGGWKHKTLADVSNDEVLELLQGSNST